jgi:hypothetical protein
MRTRILPLNSDPTSEDGDEDGILDIDEFEWNGIDELYKDVSPLKADTVESLYPELSDPTGHNQEDNPVYLEIKGNNIKIYVRYNFLDNDPSIAKEHLIVGAKYNWSHSYDSNTKEILDHFNGKLYDFYPGMKITVELNFIDTKSHSIDIEVHDNEKGKLSYHNSIYGWTISNDLKYVKLFRKQDAQVTHSNDTLKYIFSHELGHVFGLGDAYPEPNDGYEVYTKYTDPNLEFNNAHGYGTFDAGDIMSTNGLSSSNDIEMVLQAFVENKMQFFSPTPNKFDISTIMYFGKTYLSIAIKNPLIIYTKEDTETKIPLYYWYDCDSNNYIKIGDKTSLQSHLNYFGFVVIDDEN